MLLWVRREVVDLSRRPPAGALELFPGLPVVVEGGRAALLLRGRKARERRLPGIRAEVWRKSAATVLEGLVLVPHHPAGRLVHAGRACFVDHGQGRGGHSHRGEQGSNKQRENRALRHTLHPPSPSVRQRKEGTPRPRWSHPLRQRSQPL